MVQLLKKQLLQVQILSHEVHIGDACIGIMDHVNRWSSLPEESPKNETKTDDTRETNETDESLANYKSLIIGYLENEKVIGWNPKSILDEILWQVNGRIHDSSKIHKFVPKKKMLWILGLWNAKFWFDQIWQIMSGTPTGHHPSIPQRGKSHGKETASSRINTLEKAWSCLTCRSSVYLVHL